MSSIPVFYPNVSTVPSESRVTGSSPKVQEQQSKDAQEFGRIFENALENESVSPNLNQIKAPLKFSAHATQRLNDRKISLDQPTLTKIGDAIDKADAKGVEDTLVLTPNAALIVNVKNRMVVTAMDRGSLNGNVFTNIDGAVIV